jgi:hypothetical protein
VYIADGSDVDYSNVDKTLKVYGERGFESINPIFENLYAWGWLEKGHDFPTGWGSSEDKKKEIIETLKQAPVVDHYCGSHGCHFCASEIASKDYWDSSSCGSIKIAHGDHVFCSPQNVYHYIEVHDYRPANAIIEAIFNGKFYTCEDLDKIGYEMHKDRLPEHYAEIDRRIKKFEDDRREQKEIELNEVREAHGLPDASLEELLKLGYVPKYGWPEKESNHITGSRPNTRKGTFIKRV